MNEKQESHLRKELDRGTRAARLLQDPVFTEAFAEVEAKMLESLINAPVRDTQGVHELKLMIQCLRKVRGHIERWAATGRMASKELSRWERLKQATRNTIGA